MAGYNINRRGSVRLTVALYAAEESPHTIRTRSRMQVRVARVTALAQKRHVLPIAMMRPSLRARRPSGRVNSLSGPAGNGGTVNPYGCKSEQGETVSGPARVWRVAECRIETEWGLLLPLLFI